MQLCELRNYITPAHGPVLPYYSFVNSQLSKLNIKKRPGAKIVEEIKTLTKYKQLVH